MTQPPLTKPIVVTPVSSKEWAEKIVSSLWNTGSVYEDYVREIAQALDALSKENAELREVMKQHPKYLPLGLRKRAEAALEAKNGR